MIQKEYDRVLRIMIVGDSNVGKTSLISKYSNGVFNKNESTTIGIDYKNKKVHKHGINIKLQLWDTAGEKRYHSLTNASLRDADGIILAYDITNLPSFTSIKDNWISVINNRCRKDTVVVLAGDKKDLENSREVSSEDAYELAKFYNYEFYETSAKNDLNVENIFDYIVDKLLEKLSQTDDRVSTKDIKLEKESDMEKACSCEFSKFPWW